MWYDDKDIANILSLTNLVKNYRVVYDSNQDYAFTVDTNKGMINIRRNKQGLYLFNTTYTTANSNVITAIYGNYWIIALFSPW